MHRMGLRCQVGGDVGQGRPIITSSAPCAPQGAKNILRMSSGQSRKRKASSLLEIKGRKSFLMIAEEEIVAETSGGMNLRLNLMISYSGRAEILRACRAMVEQVAAGDLAAQDIDEETFGDNLFTRGLPDPDLLIRTSGELRISNFMLWQLAYTELHITAVLWPDFSRSDLFRALLDYQERDRRFGRVPIS